MGTPPTPGTIFYPQERTDRVGTEGRAEPYAITNDATVPKFAQLYLQRITTLETEAIILSQETTETGPSSPHPRESGERTGNLSALNKANNQALQLSSF